MPWFDILFPIVWGLVTVPLSALGFRWAGGLLSQWAKRDLGNFLPRQLWGLTATLPLIPLAVFTDGDWKWKAVILCGCCILTGLLRGFGWGDSLTLGFTKVRGTPDGSTGKKAIVMWSRILVMLAPLYLAILALTLVSSVHVSAATWAAIAATYLMTAAAGVSGYYLAWNDGPFDIPALGCSPVDPPPTGELAVGFYAAFLSSLSSFLVWSIAVVQAHV